jgi:Tfp pilus assembly protein FimT
MASFTASRPLVAGSPMSHRGTTVLELVLAIAIILVLAMLAVPRLVYVADAAAVRDETARLVAALDAARSAAIRLGANAALSIAPTSWQVLVVHGSDTLVAWHAAGAAAHGVTVAGAGGPIVFGQAGLAVGAANRTLTISRRLATRRVVISRLGRVM